MVIDMYRVLIVEDDMGIAEAIQVQARMWNLDAVCARNFRNVMEEFSAFEPHLVLLDITLPFFNGYHWCNEIRKVSKVPIIFISSASDNMNIVMAMNMGADDFIAKPFVPEVMKSRIARVLELYDLRNDLEARLAEIIAEVGATQPSDMGKVMGVATKRLAGLAEGRMISTLVKKLLSR